MIEAWKTGEKFDLKTFKEKSQNISSRVNKITGILLIVIAVFQAVKLYAI